ncbi:F0F1 ATP synthase subunit A [bacterium]|nr:F0F1 ATP synthase subunit A [bacterium]
MNKAQKFFGSIQILLFSFLITVNAYASEPQIHGEETHETAQNEHHESDHHEAAHEEHGEENFNAGDMIMHHIADGHDWHLWDWKGHAVSIPLPVILYNKERGLDVFLSSKFNHGHSTYAGYKYNHGEIVNADPNDTSTFYDISMTKNVVSIWISVIILLLVFLSVAKAYKKRGSDAPKGFQSIVEPLIVFLRDEVVKPSIGKGYERFMPFLLTVFFFIFLNNLLGLIPIFPGGANVTGNIAVTMVLAVLVLIVTLAVGNKHYYKHIVLPDVPLWLLPVMVIIEVLQVFLKPFVLMLRLFANITAGHIIILGFMSLIFIFGQMSFGGGLGAGLFSSAFSLFMSLLEILVAFLQAYVFTLLSALYFGAATEEHH